MPTFRKRLGKWRVEIARRGIRKSETFDSKQEAQAWAAREEASILAGVRGDIPNLTFKAILDRYAKEVSPSKKGGRWEIHRLEATGRDRIAQVTLKRLDTPHVSEWRNRRLQAVSGPSVRREWNLLSRACAIAIREWRWLTKNPFIGVERPKDGQPKTRIATQDEIDRLTERASPAMRRAILVALETGMRAGEIVGPKVVVGNVCVLSDTKNGTMREVPLSAKARELLAEGIDLSSGSVTELFGRYCAAEGIEGLTFHCLRRTAATRLARKLDVLELCAMFGWKDPRMVMRHYYRQDAEEVARKL